MKKLLSVLLSIMLIFGTCSVAVNGLQQDAELTEYPIVMVCGYGGSTIVRDNPDGTETQLWGLDWNEVLGIVLKRIAQLGIGLGALTLGNADYIANVVGKEVVNLLGELALNEDGSSPANIHPKFSTAEESNGKVMFDKYGGMDYQFEPDIMGLAETYIGIENVYNFNVDWRMGAVACATCLDEYIQQVKELTGKDKVNIFAVSHGGQVSATYLTLFGYKKDVHNAVLTVPAIGGAGMVYDLMREDVHLNELNLLYFIENGLMSETDFHWLVEAQQLGFLDNVCNKLVPYLVAVTRNWGSIWDFCPTAIYEDMKDKWLDETANAEVIAKSDYMHYTVMPQFNTSLQKCIDEYDINVSIVAGTDIDLTTGWEENSDGIIATAFSTGATCAPYMSRFADGYTQINPCNGNYKVSPAMTLDASTAYLPDNTWFVSGLFHGMTYWDMYTRELMMILLLTDQIEDVYSNPDYPQFHESSSPSNAVWAKFNNSQEGYVSSEDNALIVKNVSEEGYTLRLIGVACDGMDIKFDIPSTVVIKAGETAEIPFTGTVPATANTRVSLIFSYSAIGSITPLGQRVMSFTVMNGDKAEYSESNPFASAFARLPIDSSWLGGMTQFLKNIGIYNLLSVIYNIFYMISLRFA